MVSVRNVAVSRVSNVYVIGRYSLYCYLGVTGIRLLPHLCIREDTVIGVVGTVLHRSVYGGVLYIKELISRNR